MSKHGPIYSWELTIATDKHGNVCPCSNKLTKDQVYRLGCDMRRTVQPYKGLRWKANRGITKEEWQELRHLLICLYFAQHHKTMPQLTEKAPFIIVYKLSA